MRTIATLVCAGVATAALAAGQVADIPTFWDPNLLHDYELPLADPARTPRHVSREYYYALPERPVYRSYPVYAPGREPDGYLERLRAAEPERIDVRAGDMRSEADWIAAGQQVFEMPIAFDGPIVLPGMAADAGWYTRNAVPVTRDGVMPFARYVIREKGKVEIGNLACSMCHTRVMPDGSVIAGAQGNFPLDQVVAEGFEPVPEPIVRMVAKMLVGAPWDREAAARLDAMSKAELLEAYRAIPAGVLARQGTSLFFPPAIPDLIGIRDRKYLDKTGLGRHRSEADIMRYAAMNQSMDMLGNYGGFVPDAEDGRTLAPPGKAGFAGATDRYSDAQLFALAKYVYSLAPPANPNRPSAQTAQGEAVFRRGGCATCHAPPAYTSNRLVPADGFTVPAEHRLKFDVLDARVGTDPTLAMKTRRGTGYYKIPSLRGVWYRGPFEHNGSVATLEDWFDARRLRNDYVPTAFKGAGVKSRAVKGHPFGLDLSAADRAALVAFLKTL